ncbi:hypothetical protein C3L50_11375 [Flavobacterium alvei]|uniref:Pectinesterase catalytic domain-containing protein n=1 Tax=Flavobacterium alvei TaxID=2080416 RepID=A0A2S5A895_9FLAO|nr:hypothetical protein [Flavobacterium alvei]POY38734.1 hypothetical protein C3L50_11375 [Flavobacterium alvei]
MKIKLRIIVFAVLFLFFNTTMLLAQKHQVSNNKDLIFNGKHIIYKGNKIELGPKSFYIDGQLSNEEAAKHPYVYNSINEASKHLTNGTEASPMVLYIAPWVYWIDNPNDPEIRVPKTIGGTPFGLEINCEWLRFQGLSDNAQDVVLACNRGQTIGSKGNFTMLNIKGEGISSENITFGNYCNIDLIYPLNPKLNREKRSSAIVQGQLIFSNGDKVFARNTCFVSRLNLGPFWGSKRTLFDRCHFESTDDALNGTAVYLNCSFDFYSSKPFGHTSGTGAIFLNCDIQSFTRERQYFVKGSGPVAAIDTRFTAQNLDYIGWREIPDTEARYYQYNISLNAKPIGLGKDFPNITVDLTGKELLNAYRFEFNNATVYNTYNLMRGNDNWDPMGIKSIVEKAEKESGKNYSSIPTLLKIKPSRETLETGKDSVTLEATVNRFGNYELKDQKVVWKIAPEYQSLVKLEVNEDGKCVVIPINKGNETKEVIITASTESGLEAASVFQIAPAFMAPPTFTTLPRINKTTDGKLLLNYALDMTFEDESLVNWYRCRDVKGSHPIEIAVSRNNKPLKTYDLSSGDIGYYIMASISPKHLRCQAGTPKTVVFKDRISKKDIKESTILVPNFENMSAKFQPEILPGFWTLDSFAPADTNDQNWVADNSISPWFYGKGENGAANDVGFIQASKGARMRYTPVGNSFGDMKISFTAVPAKTAGQGFSSARSQYMDIGIKMDTKKINGYALRIIRTTKFSDAVDFILMKYENGVVIPISKSVTTSCYRPNCVITIEVKNKKISIQAKNTLDYFAENYPAEVMKTVNLEAEIIPNTFGGISFQHTGTIGSGATLIKDLQIEWKP